MKQYKKRTIALVLASVITVVGAFGTENYKNTIMSLGFEGNHEGVVEMTLATKQTYDQTIIPRKQDMNTYVIMLPETDSAMTEAPELGSNIASVDIKTMPYTNSSKGYTKITVKTNSNTVLQAKPILYIADSFNVKNKNVHNTQEIVKIVPNVTVTTLNDLNSVPSYTDATNKYNDNVSIQDAQKQFAYNSNDDISTNKTSIEPENSTSVTRPIEDPSQNYFEQYLLILGFILVVMLCVFFFIKSKNKMIEVLGEQLEIDLSEDKPLKEKTEKQSRRKQIKKAIDKLDQMYAKPVKMSVKDMSFTDEKMSSKKIDTQKIVEDNLVVDLDELFREQVKPELKSESDTHSEEDENFALEDFLKVFNANQETDNEQKELVYEDLYNQYINQENLHFSKDDISRIQQLLNSEISEDAISFLESNTVTNPIEHKATKLEILENLVTNYTIKQNITFTKEDIIALQKLISVEIDSDFITDLKTNPMLTAKMEQEAKNVALKSHKNSEIVTLKVKDLLPNLSEALKKQGNKKIESDYKPQVVYYSEGYEVSTLSVADSIPDLSKEVNNISNTKFKPSANYEYVESGYDVEVVSVNGLPDLHDVFLNPDKYKEQVEEAPIADEKVLLRNIEKVSFKPFYDGADDENALNNLDKDLENIDEFGEEKTELEHLDQINLESVGGIDSEQQAGFVQEKEKEAVELPKLERKAATRKERNNDAKELLERIKEKRVEDVSSAKLGNEQSGEDISSSNMEPAPTCSTCIVDGKRFDIIQSVSFSDNSGCYLAKSADKYYIIGYLNEQVYILKDYDKLKSTKIQARLSDKLSDGTVRYIIKIGVNKFILHITPEKMEYVMDLC